MSKELQDKLQRDAEINIKIIRVHDSGSNSRFVGNIMITIKRVSSGQKELFSLKINQISTRSINSDKFSINKFEATVNHIDKTISFGPAHGIHLEESLQKRGIGTYALNELIKALKNVAPNYTFNPYEITFADGATDGDREYVGQFLSKFNINLSFVDNNQKDAVLRAGTPTQLILHYNEDKIIELDPEEYIFQIMSERSKSETEINNMKAEISRIKDDSFGGIPKEQLIKYTLICCGITLLIIFLLIY